MADRGTVLRTPGFAPGLGRMQALMASPLRNCSMLPSHKSSGCVGLERDERVETREADSTVDTGALPTIISAKSGVQSGSICIHRKSLPNLAN